MFAKFFPKAAAFATLFILLAHVDAGELNGKLATLVADQPYLNDKQLLRHTKERILNFLNVPS